MARNFIIPLAVYPFDVMVSIAESDKELWKHCKDFGIRMYDFKAIKYPDDCCLGRYCMFPGNQTVIRIRKAPSKPEEYGLLQHEIFHAVSCVLDRIGMKLVLQDNDEAYAYLTQYLTTEIYKRL